MTPPPPAPEIDAYVAQLVRDAPPLSPDQAARIMILLRQDSDVVPASPSSTERVSRSTGPGRQPTLDEIRKWPAAVQVAQAATALGVSRSQLYEQIRRGVAPVKVIEVGARRKVVVTASIVQLLS